jgi:hypothetical protein
MKVKLQFLLSVFLIIAGGFYLSGCAAPDASLQTREYKGMPFRDSVYQGGPQKIPGRVQCAYYDFGGEGIAYHTSDTINRGSGTFNKPDGTYLNEFRMHESVGISYTKFHRKMPIDDNPFDLVRPPENQLYVGWTQPGEWFNMTVNIKHAGIYAIDLLYTSNRGGKISLDLNGKPLVTSIDIASTRNDKDAIAWRQWHHWNLMTDMAEVKLPKGMSVLTFHILSEGNMNLAYLDFKPKSG